MEEEGEGKGEREVRGVEVRGWWGEGLSGLIYPLLLSIPTQLVWFHTMTLLQLFN